MIAATLYYVYVRRSLLGLPPSGSVWPRFVYLLAMAAAALTTARSGPVTEEHDESRAELIGGLVPYLPTLALLVVLLWRQAAGGLGEDQPVLWLVCPLFGVFMLRQVLALDELRRLSLSLEHQVEERSRALERAHEQLVSRRRLESLGRLAGGVAHDFNNLLTGIAGYVHLMTRRMRPGGPEVAHVRELKRAVERGAGLTRQILGFARRPPSEALFASAPLARELEELLIAERDDEPSRPLATPAANPPGACHVLLVDDSPVLRATLVESLGAAGFDVTAAASGEAALELARSDHAIDVLVTDMRMTGMNGLATARAIATIRPGVHVILMSGFADGPDEQLPPELDFLAKPFAPPELMRRIRQVTRRPPPSRF
jgi:CheY-like chemotaxis protein